MKTGTYFLLFSLLLIQACGKDSDTPTVSRGTLNGTVVAYDDKTNATASPAGFTVTLSPGGTSTTTDATGKFSFPDLAYDNYELTFTKTGYGTFKIFGLNVQSPSTNLPTVSLGALSTTTVTSLALNNNQYNGGPGVSYIYSTSPAPTTSNRGYTRAFLGSTAQVSNTLYAAFSGVRSNASNNVTGGFTADELYAFGLRTGQTVYVKIYGESAFSNSYTDPATGKTIFPNLNPSSAPAISFIVP